MSELKRVDEQGGMWESRPILKRGRFHLVCFRRPVERLKVRVKRLFRGDNLSRLVNTFIRNLEPFLVYHINLDRSSWQFSLKNGNRPEEFEYIYDEEGRFIGKIPEKMRSHLYIELSYRNYRLLKKMHEACNTYSMAMILRSLICFCLDGYDEFGDYGFWRRMRKWTREHCPELADKVVPQYSQIPSHMLRLKDVPTVRVSHYDADYRHKRIEYFHPPPGNN